MTDDELTRLRAENISLRQTVARLAPALQAALVAPSPLAMKTCENCGHMRVPSSRRCESCAEDAVTDQASWLERDVPALEEEVEAKDRLIAKQHKTIEEQNREIGRLIAKLPKGDRDRPRE